MAAKITVACPTCATRTTLSTEFLGSKIQCRCGMSFSVSPVFAVIPKEGMVSRIVRPFQGWGSPKWMAWWKQLWSHRRVRTLVFTGCIAIVAGGTAVAAWLINRPTIEANQAELGTATAKVDTRAKDKKASKKDADSSWAKALTASHDSRDAEHSKASGPGASSSGAQPSVGGPQASASGSKPRPTPTNPSTGPKPSAATGSKPDSSKGKGKTSVTKATPPANVTPSTAKSGTPPTRPAPVAAQKSVGADRLWDAFDLDPTRAQAEYVGKSVQLLVRGKLERDAAGQPYYGARVVWPTPRTPAELDRLSAQQKAWEQSGYPASVRCYLAADQVAIAEKMSATKVGVVVGECTGRQDDSSAYMGYYVVLRNCRFVQ